MAYKIVTLEPKAADREQQLNDLETAGWVLQMIDGISGYFRKDGMLPFVADYMLKEIREMLRELQPQMPEYPMTGMVTHVAERETAATGGACKNAPAATVNSSAHHLVNRLKCSCGFAVNPKNFDKLREHLEQNK